MTHTHTHPKLSIMDTPEEGRPKATREAMIIYSDHDNNNTIIDLSVFSGGSLRAKHKPDDHNNDEERRREGGSEQESERVREGMGK